MFGIRIQSIIITKFHQVFILYHLLIILIQNNMNNQDNNGYNITYDQDLMTIIITGTNAFILNLGFEYLFECYLL